MYMKTCIDTTTNKDNSDDDESDEDSDDGNEAICFQYHHICHIVITNTTQ